MRSYRLHVLALPHTQTTNDYSMCAYTQKIRKFCTMMSNVGNEVFLYGGNENEAVVTENIPCITRAQQAEFGLNGPKDILKGEYNYDRPYWKLFNENCIKEIRKRIQPKDIICVIAGLCQKPVTDQFPENLVVEWGVGYEGTYSRFRVFESYAWMHTIYGQQQGANNANGNFYDCVIPNFFEDDYFPFVPSDERSDYALFMGRLIDRKGYHIAADVCKRLGIRLKVAGEGTPPVYGEYVGVVGPEERAELFSKAQFSFMPSLYLEPFGAVQIESMFCGTPVLTTDWGSCPEINVQGVTGYRCRSLAEFLEGARRAPSLNRAAIRKYAIDRFSMNTIQWQYQDYLDQLWTLHAAGWYEERPIERFLAR